MRQLEHLYTVLVSPLLADVKLPGERPLLLCHLICLCVKVDMIRTRASKEEQKAVIRSNSKRKEEKENEILSYDHAYFKLKSGVKEH